MSCQAAADDWRPVMTFYFCLSCLFSMRLLQVRSGPQSSSKAEPLWIAKAGRFTGQIPSMSPNNVKALNGVN